MVTKMLLSMQGAIHSLFIYQIVTSTKYKPNPALELITTTTVMIIIINKKKQGPRTEFQISKLRV